MSKLHFVFGGRVKDPRGLDFDLDTVEMVGLYPDYAARSTPGAARPSAASTMPR